MTGKEPRRAGTVSLMARACLLLLVMGELAVASEGGTGSEPAERTWMDVGMRWVHPQVRQLDVREQELQQQLSSLPKPNAGQKSESFGYHSQITIFPDSTKWVQVDLGRSAAIDAVALIPAHVVFGDNTGPGYGFPLRFRIDLSEDPEFLKFETLVDQTEADVPNPGDSPYYVEATGRTCRYVRLTATRLSKRRDFGILAMAEMVVLAGRRNLAAGRHVTALDSIESPPLWARANLVDSQSVLGIPSEAEISRRNGYHSIELEQDANAVKWVQVDLGESVLIDEIRLIPARPVDFADIVGFGFPVRFRVEVCADAECAESEVVFDRTGENFPNPGDNLVVLPVDGRWGRYVRVTATRLWERTGDYAFALAEMEVYSEDWNVAFGRSVSASESHELGDWSTAYLVDGYSSQYRLGDLSNWLLGLARRHELDVLLINVRAERARLAEGFVTTVIQVLGGTLAFLFCAGGLAAWGYRVNRTRQVERIRNQIARDLHDEIGSNLGTIALLSQVASSNASRGEGVGADLGEIRRIALETAESMREIVWLVTPGCTNAELVTHMRELAGIMLKGIEHRFEDSSRALPGKVSLEFRRNFFLIFKEVLHNVVKHSAARNVEIRLERSGTELMLRVADDGCGFEPAAVTPGRGLGNIRHRTKVLGARLTIESEAGRGTVVEVRVPTS